MDGRFVTLAIMDERKRKLAAEDGRFVTFAFTDERTNNPINSTSGRASLNCCPCKSVCVTQGTRPDDEP